MRALVSFELLCYAKEECNDIISVRMSRRTFDTIPMYEKIFLFHFFSQPASYFSFSLLCSLLSRFQVQHQS